MLLADEDRATLTAVVDPRTRLRDGRRDRAGDRPRPPARVRPRDGRSRWRSTVRRRRPRPRSHDHPRPRARSGRASRSAPRATGSRSATARRGSRPRATPAASTPSRRCARSSRRRPAARRHDRRPPALRVARRDARRRAPLLRRRRRLPRDRPPRGVQAQRAAPAPVRRPGLADRDRRVAAAGRGRRARRGRRRPRRLLHAGRLPRDRRATPPRGTSRSCRRSTRPATSRPRSRAYPELAGDGARASPTPGTEVGFSSLDAHDERDLPLPRRRARRAGRAHARPVPAHRRRRGAQHDGRGLPGVHGARAAARGGARQARRRAGRRSPSVPLPEGAVVQYWNTEGERGPDLARAAAAQGARLVMSPGGPRLPRHEVRRATRRSGWRGPATSRSATATTGTPRRWSTGVGEDAIAGRRGAAVDRDGADDAATSRRCCFPRLCAVAEVAWSPQHVRDWDGFRARLAAQAPRWDAAGVAYHRSPQVWG